MGIQHINIKNGNCGNAKKHAQYIAGIGKYGDRDDVLYIEDSNLPDWANNADDFFSASDQFERSTKTQKMKTKDGKEYEKTIKGRSYKEIELAIPREAKDKIKWAKDFTEETLGKKHTYRLAIHDKQASDGGRNVHMHLMFSTREIDEFKRTKEQFFKRAASAYRHAKTKELIQRPRSDGGAIKSKFWNSREAVEVTRRSFERHVQLVDPDFKMQRSSDPEPKIGPEKKKAGKEYEEQRVKRSAVVFEIRDLKSKRESIDREIVKENDIDKKLFTDKKVEKNMNKRNTSNLDEVVDEKEKRAAIIHRIDQEDRKNESNDDLWNKLEKDSSQKEKKDRDIER